MSSESVGVVGLGFLGRGIAACFLAHGFRVVGYDTGKDALEQVKGYIATAIDELIEYASFPPSLKGEWKARFTGAEGLSQFAECHFVIESVFEDLAVKQAVFDQLEEVVHESTPIASNTSAIPIGVLQNARKVPSRFLGMHWSEPAYATRFLELIKGEGTSDEVLE